MTLKTEPTIQIANKRSGATGEYVGRPSPLGNPYVIGRDGDREEVIALYRMWLRDRIAAGDEAVLTELNRLLQILLDTDTLTLVCWCHPLPCHADVIKEAIETWITPNTPGVRKWNVKQSRKG